MEKFKRQTAYKFWIKKILGVKWELDEEGILRFDIGGLKVSRVNLIGNVINKYEGNNYSYLTIDDGSGQIRLKVWGDDIKLLNKPRIGDTVLVVGKISQSQGEIFIRPEIVRVIDKLWLKVRKRELEKAFGELEKIEEAESVEEEVVEDQKIIAKGKILNIIEKEASEDGIDMIEVIKKSGIREDEAEEIINELLKEGEIFETRPGRLQIT